MKPSPLLAVCLCCCVVLPVVVSVVSSTAAQPVTQEVTVSFIGPRTITQKFMVDNETIHSLRSSLSEFSMRLVHAQNAMQRTAVLSQLVKELDTLHLLPSTIRSVDVMREISLQSSVNYPCPLVQSTAKLGPVNLLCLVDVWAFRTIDVNC